MPEESRLRRRLTRFVSIETKLVLAAVLLIVGATVTLNALFSSFVAELVIQERVRLDLFSFQKAGERVARIRPELDAWRVDAERSLGLSELLQVEVDDSSPDVVTRHVEMLNRVGATLFAGNDYTIGIVMVDTNGLVFQFRPYEEGTYLGRTDESADFGRMLFGTTGPTTDVSLGPLHAEAEPVRDNGSSIDPVLSALTRQHLVHQVVHDSDGHRVAHIFFVIDLSFLDGFYSSKERASSFGLVDAAQRVVWRASESGDMELRGDFDGDYTRIRDNGEEYLVTRKRLPGYRYTMVRTRRVADITENVDGVRVYVFLLMAPMLVVVTILSRRTAASIARPITVLLGRLGRSSSPMPPHESSKSAYDGLAKRLFDYFALSVILPGTVLLLVAFHLYTSAYRTELDGFSRRAIQLRRDILENYMSTIRGGLQDLLFTPRVQETLYRMSLDETTHGSSSAHNRRFSQESAQWRADSGIGLEIYDESLRCTTPECAEGASLFERTELARRDELERSRGELVPLGISDDDYARARVSFARKVYYINSVYNPSIGYAGIHIPLSTIQERIAGEIQPRHDFLVLSDMRGNQRVLETNSVSSDVTDLDIVLQSEPSEEDRVHNVGEFRVARASSPSFGVSLASVVARETIVAILTPLRWYALLTLIGVLAAVVVASGFLSLSIIVPFRRLLWAVQHEVSNSVSDIRVSVFGYSEIALLSDEFNQLVQQINTLASENYAATMKQRELEYLQKEARFLALQQQINPHFLHNTLDSINWMAFKAGASEVCKMISALARFLRGVISDEQLIPVGREVDHLEHYIYIQQQRFIDRITFEIEIDDSILQEKTLKLLLQPFVENSIIHGLEGVDGTGKVTVRGRRDGDDLLFEIEDDGVGISSQTAKRLERAGPGATETAESVGVVNVMGRLRMHFGESAAVTLRPRAPHGTRVVIRHACEDLVVDRQPGFRRISSAVEP
jgi:sensor histidine kinase YesM